MTSTAEPQQEPSTESSGAGTEDGVSFVSTSSLSDVAWSGSIIGFVVEEPSSRVEYEGDCVILLGTLTPRAIIKPGVSIGFTAPSMTIRDNEDEIENTISDCQSGGTGEAGYRITEGADVTIGSVYPFRKAFLLPEGVSAPDELTVVVGDRTNDERQELTASRLQSLPQAEPSGEPLVEEPLSAGTVVSSSYDSPSVHLTWDVVIEGIIQVDRDSTENGGVCVAVLGTFTPTEAENETAMDDSFFAPPISVIANGWRWATDLPCDEDSIEEAGYRETDEADVPIGTPFRFYKLAHLEYASSLSEVEAVTVGNYLWGDVSLVHAPLLDAFPAETAP